jgi:hydroxyacylglutathione hydrolase
LDVLWLVVKVILTFSILSVVLVDMFDIIPIPAFTDNYIWLVANKANRQCIVVDPGDAAPVLDVLRQNDLTLNAILITHHHHDHTGGIEVLHEHFTDVPVYGPASENIPCMTHPLVENDVVNLPMVDLNFHVLDIPGHTKGHIAYHGKGMLFCGDTLFSAGCGRLFEGTAEQMYTSLSKLAGLPEDTLVYCAHEYTAANLRFAQTVEADNPDIQKRISEIAVMRGKNQPTLPSVMRFEKLTNPFLRCEMASVIDSVEKKTHTKLTDPTAVFQSLRAWKDTF